MVALGLSCTLSLAPPAAVTTSTPARSVAGGMDGSSSPEGSLHMDASVGIDGFIGSPDGPAADADVPDTATGERAEEVFDGGVKRTFYWADWTAATTGVDGGASGTFALPSGAVQVTYHGDLMDVQLTPATRNFWAIKESYTSATVEKAPDNTDALLIDGVVNSYGEVVFSRPVKDPVFAFAEPRRARERLGGLVPLRLPVPAAEPGQGLLQGRRLARKAGEQHAQRPGSRRCDRLPGHVQQD